MRSQALLLAGLAISSHGALAQPDCARATVQALAEGPLSELTRRFSDDSPQLGAELQSMRDLLGRLTRLEPVNAPMTGTTLRTTVARRGLPSSYSYHGLWLNAESSKLGQVQFHVAVKPGSDCELLALHLHRAAQP